MLEIGNGFAVVTVLCCEAVIFCWAGVTHAERTFRIMR